MLFSAPQQARTTLSHLCFFAFALCVVLVLIWWVSIPSALRLAVELQHPGHRLAKDLRKSIWLVDTIDSSFRSLASGNKNFLFSIWSSALRMHLLLFVGWTVMTHLMMCRKTKNRNLPLGCSWANFINKTLLDFFPVAPRESWDRSVVIVLLTSCTTIKLFRVLLVLGYSLDSFASYEMGSALHRGFHTDEHDHTCRIGCPDEPDSLTHYNECSRLYNIFLSFWRHATILPRRNHMLHDLITRVFLQSLQYGIVVLGFLDAFVCAHHQHRQDFENPGNFGDCMKGRIRFVTAITPTYAHAYQATCFVQHFPGVPHQAQVQISIPSQCSFHNT